MVDVKLWWVGCIRTYTGCYVRSRTKSEARSLAKKILNAKTTAGESWIIAGPLFSGFNDGDDTCFCDGAKI